MDNNNGNNGDDDSLLLDPELLKGLTPKQRKEALAAAAAAKRAEERAEQRALERAMERKRQEREEFNLRQEKLQARQQQKQLSLQSGSGITNGGGGIDGGKIVFRSKKQRLHAGQQEASDKNDIMNDNQKMSNYIDNTTTATATTTTKTKTKLETNSGTSAISAGWTEKELRAIKQSYLGKSSTDKVATNANEGGANNRNNNNSNSNKRGKKNGKGSGVLRSHTKKMTFRFEWDDTDDTLDQSDPLYGAAPSMSSASHAKKKKRKKRAAGEDDDLFDDDNNQRFNVNYHRTKTLHSVKTKPLEKMTLRDWRIFRENYEIVVKGGKAPNPLRTFQESIIHDKLKDALINVMHYKEPTPIQRQAIPIGLERRDLIGIAETGSGKTCAFGVPLIHSLLQLPRNNIRVNQVAEEGPLALVLAPTRELALQINGELQKLLSRQSTIISTAIVGGQPIQQQAQILRQGVHIVVGTPGRLNDCLEMAYLVLNQCSYVVLDEADRMIDMGFAPQLESILDSMGGILKSESESVAHEQVLQDAQANALPKHRITAMFSATMPLEVEKLAKRYLRHPAIISIGDADSSKNARIVQRIIFLASPSQKENALRDLLHDPRFIREKVIVFVNEKKHADVVGRMVDRMGKNNVVLHGGKSQEQREESLATFRNNTSGIVLVATDVAGRGLDIPDVAHVINYDLPTRSIDSYTHRIGRTGRAGKDGLATSLLTNDDEGIMVPLKAYLESTGNAVPEKLARHPAASGSVAMGNVIL